MNVIKKLIKNIILTDTHAHICELEFDDDRKNVVDRALKSNISLIIDVGVNLSTSHKALRNAKLFDNVLSTAGLHPEACVEGSDLYIDSEKKISQEFSQLELWYRNLSKEDKDCICMIGETGIDTFWMEKNNISKEKLNHCLEVQKSLFKKHIDFANFCQLPLTIHSRNSIEICFGMLEKVQTDVVFHCLTPDIKDDEKSFYKKVSKILERGFYISINGIITFRNAQILRNTFFKVLKEKNKQGIKSLEDIYNTGFVLETDSPLLAPEGKRGERNEPENIKLIFEYIQQNVI